ncbi:hypothetical protein PAT3040_02322 [Paenibacillus agaridevorans]|uniref:Uncharacterized protein n=1 Tax=Paenibacillus agaridevorans TaxID=171404 RepID=A0A2R5EWI2_9BACL|nr:hypothetical protein PAT3040_02322 [Paenibacillus agaridevorans]
MVTNKYKDNLIKTENIQMITTKMSTFSINPKTEINRVILKKGNHIREGSVGPNVIITIAVATIVKIEETAIPHMDRMNT